MMAVALHEWIDGAVASIDVKDEPLSLVAFGADPRLLALTTDAFLESALEVARSLAEYIIFKSEEENGKHDYFLPRPGSNWADFVTVHVLSESHDGGGGNDPVGGKTSESKRVDSQGATDRTQKNLFLSVEEAQFSSPSNISDLDSSTDGDGVRHRNTDTIYSLGLVFYQIFSGGEKPHKMSHKANPSAKGVINLDVNQNSAIDFSTTLNIFDDLTDATGVFHHLDNNNDTGEGTNEGRRAKRIQTGEIMSLISLEPLKSKNLPGPLCDLIANMIDSINGDLSGAEAYLCMSDVLSDLQLMLGEPKYLHGLDFEKLAMSGLQLSDTLFGRETELSALQNSYNRSVSGQMEMAIISGHSGTGKSFLAERLGNYVRSTGGVFISGKFDQLEQAKPLSAVAAAFDEYCGILIKEREADCLWELASNLTTALGKEAYYLTELMPNLSIILPEDAGDFGQDQDCSNAQNRLFYLLCGFVEITSSFFGSTITLLLDDLQWSHDQASIEVIRQLLLTSSGKHFHLIGCCREMDEGHAILDMLSTIRRFGIHVTTVTLKCMDVCMINSMISELLCLSPRLTMTLSNHLYHKTKGSPLFLCQLLVSLNKEGLLRLSLSRRRWVWDEEKIQSRHLPDDVMTFISSTIMKLPQEVQLALNVLSFLGARSEQYIVEALEKKLGMSLLKHLEVAVAEGLVIKKKDEYCFCHDRVQEVMYNMTNLENRALLHYKYGVALSDAHFDFVEDSTYRDSVIFVAVGQINRGGPSAVSSVDQAVRAARLNLLVGTKASCSDFVSAHPFYRQGIAFLPSNHWQDHYDLSLKLFVGAAKGAFALGDLADLNLLSEQVLSFAKSFKDKLEILYIAINTLTFTSKLPESFHQSVSILEQLDERFPASVSESYIKLQLVKTKLMLRQISDDQLLNYKTMTDEFKLYAMKFYSRLEGVTQHIQPMTQPIITLQIINLSISHGMSQYSPIGFAYYGTLLARRGDISEGHRYVKIARQLLDRIGSKEVEGEVICLSTQVKCFVEPLQAVLDYHLEGHAASMATGDIYHALRNSYCHAFLLLSTGNCQLSREKLDQAINLAERHNHQMGLVLLMPLRRAVMMLMIGNEDKVNNMTAIQGEDNLRRKNPLVAATTHFYNCFVAFMFRNYDQMLYSAKHYCLYNMKSWSLEYVYAFSTYVTGLVSFWVFRKSKDPKWADRGHKAKLDLKKWADSSGWNFQSKFHLLEAEEFFSHKNFEDASLSYENAISSAKKHRFVWDEALACELAGYFFLEQGEIASSLKYSSQAHEKYHEWGASAKSDALLSFIQQNLMG